MATLASNNLTLIDLQKRMDPDGEMATIVELLDQSSEMLQDMTFVVCNDGSSHQTTIRTGLPHGTWVGYNEGTQPSKSTTAQVRATTGHLEAVSQVSKRIAEKGGNPDEVRASEAVAH